jgi:hypothetical protein
MIIQGQKLIRLSSFFPPFLQEPVREDAVKFDPKAAANALLKHIGEEFACGWFFSVGLRRQHAPMFSEGVLDGRR